MGVLQTKVCLRIVVKSPIAPTIGVMALRAQVSETSAVDIVLGVAIHA